MKGHEGAKQQPTHLKTSASGAQESSTVRDAGAKQQLPYVKKSNSGAPESVAVREGGISRRQEQGESAGSPTTPIKAKNREKVSNTEQQSRHSPSGSRAGEQNAARRDTSSHVAMTDAGAAYSSPRSPTTHTDLRRRGSGGGRGDGSIEGDDAQQRQQQSSSSPAKSSPNAKTVFLTKSTKDAYSSPHKSPQTSPQHGAPQRSPPSPRRTTPAINGEASPSASHSNGKNERRNSGGNAMASSSGQGGASGGNSPPSTRSTLRRKSLSPSRSPRGQTDSDALRRLADSAADSMSADLSTESNTSTSGNHHASQEDAALSSAYNAESSARNVKAGGASDLAQGRELQRHEDDEVDVSGDASISSQSAPTSLSATLARGAHHQCGTARRVKVYELKGEVWFDRGTGYCAGVYDEQNDAALLVARMEETCRRLTLAAAGGGEEGMHNRPSSANEGSRGTEGTANDEQIGAEGREDREHYVLVVSETLDSDDLLLKARVVKDDVYQRQQDTLVVWTEPDGTDMALSFQEADGCHEVWEFLAEVQKHFLLSARGDGLDMDDGGEGMTSGMLGMSAAGMTTDNALVMSDGSPFAMPEPRLENLAAIEMTLKDAASRSQQAREKVAQWILREDYIAKLSPVFQDAEELEQLESLHRLCAIVHTIIMLNDNVLIERLLHDDVFISVVGMLEYDPEFPRLKASYREYLLKTARFRQVVRIPDEMILIKIHQTFRLQYLKDVILARTLDDSTFAVLNSLIFYHQADIVAFCTGSEAFLSTLFGLFEQRASEPEMTPVDEARKAEAIIFLQQLCAVGKQVQLPSRLALYRTLTEWGLLIVLEYALSRKESRLRNAAAEILMTIIEYDASGVRMHILEQIEPNEGSGESHSEGKRSASLLTILAKLLHEVDGDPGLKTQVTESLRILFDSGPDGASGGPVVAQTLAAAAHSADEGQRKDDAERFLNWFYDGEVDTLFAPLKSLRKYKEPPPPAASAGGERLNQADSRPPPARIVAPPSHSALLYHLCELLTFVMAHHHFRSQYWVISSDIGVRVTSLLFAREKHLRLAALRFFRACLARDNQFINRHFVKIGLLSAILGVVEAESARDNLVTSACLEFFEHIRKDNIKPLINHLMDKHEARVRTLTRHNAIGHYFQAMILQWERSNEVPPAPASDAEGATAGTSNSQLALFEAERERRLRDVERRGGNRASMDVDEEQYFNDDDDYDDSDEEGTAGRGLPSSEGMPTMNSVPPPPPPTYGMGRPRAGSGLVPYVAPDDQEGADDFAAAANTASADLSALSDSIGAASNESSEISVAADTSHNDEGAPTHGGSGVNKRKERASDEEEEDGMGRLAKRKSLLSAGDEAPAAKTAKLASAAAASETTPADEASSEAQKTAGGGKRVSITLSSATVEKVASEGKGEEEEEQQG